jgi:N-acetylneuraminate synthase
MNKVLVISEIGINANGDIENAKKLIKMSKDCGADLVKFQKRNIEKVYSRAELDKYRESPWGTTNREQKLGLEFREIEYDIINAYCRMMEIDWFASPWDLDSVKFLKKYNLKYNKIASPRLRHKELLEAVAKEGKYTFISTGMSSTEEITNAVEIFKKYDCPFELMHCNSKYPLEANNANLNVIKLLRRTFDCNVGYSGHEPGIITSVAAVALGATSIERHITLNRAMYGSDQSSSLEATGLRKLVEYIREVEISLGDGEKRISNEEWEIRKKLDKEQDEK